MCNAVPYAALLCLLALGATSVLASPKPEGADFIIQSHRGAGKLAPDNSLLGFKLAWHIGTIPEADPRITRDGVLVAFHDNNLRRLAPDADPAIIDKSVNDLDWDVVSKLDVGSYMAPKYAGIHIPRISDVLDEMKGHRERWLYLDIKKLPLEKLADVVRERGLDSQVVMASTKYDEIRQWKRLLPKSNTLHWMGGSQQSLADRLAELRKTHFADITQLQIHVNVGNLDSAEPFSPSSPFLREVGREVKAKGMLFQALVIGSADARAYRKLMDLGVESFATDDPLVTLEVMREHLRKSKAR